VFAEAAVLAAGAWWLKTLKTEKISHLRDSSTTSLRRGHQHVTSEPRLEIQIQPHRERSETHQYQWLGL
jgi:hypothetical protein